MIYNNIELCLWIRCLSNFKAISISAEVDICTNLYIMRYCSGYDEVERDLWSPSVVGGGKVLKIMCSDMQLLAFGVKEIWILIFEI